MSRTARSARSVALAVLVVAAALIGVGVGIGGAAGAAASAGAATADQSTNAHPAASPAPGIAVQDVEYDRFEFEVTVDADGDARWTFRYKRVLENETDRRDFEAFAAEFNENDTEVYRNFRERAARLTARAENTSGIDRPMNATGFRREAFVTGVAADNLGVVEMSFLWTNAATGGMGDRVVLGDVFAGGFYLGPNQSMVVSAGEGVALDRAQPEPDGRITGAVTYEGERTFADRRPRVVFVPAGSGTVDGGDGSGPGSTASPGGTAPSTGTGAAGGDGSGGDPDGDGGGLPLSWLALGALLLLGAGAAVAYRAGAFDRDGGTAGAADSSSGGAGGAAGADASGADPEPAVPDEELVSDEDRVVNLLEESGGRMKQVAIVEETGWSKSKVSMLLSEMEEEGTISKLRIGRENVISLAGHEPEAAGSPFDEED